MSKTKHLCPEALQQAVPDCTGCAACMNACPTGAIIMPLGEDGFYRPYVDSAACINCGKCLKTCPVYNDDRLMELQAPKPEKIEPEFYYGWSKDREIRLKSSSGGFFSELARYAFSRGGCIFGVSVGEQAHPYTCKAESMEELERLRGSKYLQAKVGLAYKDVLAELKKERYVVYAGTPCQIGGLKAFLGKSYENLLTVDLICHGVPSYNLMRRYIETMAERTGHEPKVSLMRWRDKRRGWYQHQYGMHMVWADGAETYSGKPHDLFLRGFLKDYFLNEGCHHCRYTGLARKLPDITMADAWEIWLHHPEIDYTDGVSLLLAHTIKGRAVLHELPMFAIFRADGENALRYNPAVLHSWPAPAHKEACLRDFAHMSLQKLLDKYAPLHPRRPMRQRVRELLRRVRNKIKSMLLHGV